MLETIRNLGEHVIPYFRTGPGKKLIDERDERRNDSGPRPAGAVRGPLSGGR